MRARLLICRRGFSLSMADEQLAAKNASYRQGLD